MPCISYKEIHYSYFETYFYIDETSPSCLRWKIDKGKGKDKRYAGDIAGCLKNGKYWVLKINQSEYSVHRVIYAMYNKVNITCSELVIDHIDGSIGEIGKNNSPTNLRLVSKQVNQLNKIKAV